MYQSNRARVGVVREAVWWSRAARLAVAIGLVAGNATAATPLPDQTDDLHLGVVSCAGSTCHGAPETLRDSNVLNTEFVIWNREDQHARAYKVLLEKDGQRIARNLGLPSWQEGMTPEQEDAFHEQWKECLVCHADYVPAERRGKRHQMADGVGCEACHGGGGRYLGPHVSGIASHEENVENGLYPTELPAERAKLCLSCHLGTNDKFATHRIMGAGHPRLSFELDTFTQLQPPHFRIDDDYRKRKAVYGNPGAPRVVPGATVALTEAYRVYLARTYAYVAVGGEGLAIIDVERPEQPKLFQRFDAGGVIDDARDVIVGTTNASAFAYVADGANGLRVVQLTSPERQPKFYGFSPAPNPELIASRPTKSPALALSKGLDRDRAVDESGGQIAILGRIGSRPFNEAEQRRFYSDRNGSPWYVTDRVKHEDFLPARRAPPGPMVARGGGAGGP